jgi:hypothetical protein
VVIGGVQTQEWPGERPGCFTIGVKITGRKPVYAASGVRGAEKGDRT